MKDTTRKALKKFISDFVARRLSGTADLSLDELRKAHPFHGLFFRDEALIAFKLQRSIVTAMGRGFYPKIAKLIAEDTYLGVHLDYKLQGELDVEQCNKIEEIVTALRTGTLKPNHSEELSGILKARGGGKRTASVIADIFIDDSPGGPFFAEIKTPKPNLDICAESKKKILYFWAIMNSLSRPSENAYLALPYNPYLTRDLYSWPYTALVLDMNKQVLIGEEFWDKIGGKGSYQELLQILAEVGAEIRLK